MQKETKARLGYLEKLLPMVFLMVLSPGEVKRVRKATKGRRGRRETQVHLVLPDYQDDQDSWVPRVNQLWALLVLLVLQDNLVLLEQDVLEQEVHPALLDSQDLYLPMDQSLFLVHLVRLVRLVLQDMPTRLPPTRHSTL